MPVRATALTAALGLLGLLAGALTAPAGAKTRAPKVLEVRCVPKTKPGCGTRPQVPVGAQVQFRGQSFKRGMRVTFRWSRGALATKLDKTRVGWVARVPAGTTTGTVSVYLTDKAGRRSNKRRVTIVADAPQTKPASRPAGPLPAVFAGNGMWIWVLKSSSDGNLDAIAARAKAAGMATVFVKSADGTTPWGQFTPALVAGLKARGLNVCAWQFVYGDKPAGEAAAAVSSIRAGADCFVIDAETHYEGRYSAAQTYLTALRSAIGKDYPLGLTSFPYVDYHPRLPYSVFLGPDGAQANLPQVYWKDIGGSVDAVSAKTVAQNRIYERAIVPLGQTYQSPSAKDLRRFRAIWAGYGSPGLSWWSWQATPSSLWPVLNEPDPKPIVSSDPGWPTLTAKSKGDQVIWLHMHLAAFDGGTKITSTFTSSTAKILSAFQASRGLPVTGETDAETWQELLKLAPVAADWS